MPNFHLNVSIRKPSANAAPPASRTLATPSTDSCSASLHITNTDVLPHHAIQFGASITIDSPAQRKSGAPRPFTTHTAAASSTIASPRPRAAPLSIAPPVKHVHVVHSLNARSRATRFLPWLTSFPMEFHREILHAYLSLSVVLSRPHICLCLSSGRVDGRRVMRHNCAAHVSGPADMSYAASEKSEETGIDEKNAICPPKVTRGFGVSLGVVRARRDDTLSSQGNRIHHAAPSSRPASSADVAISGRAV
ncbi:hypothetical protein R3P38DRAFT_3182521 [Favolaschia claudopus]|uniref:Uncharacterized protein n=1 Tax=Favolaschia claudopus TaxID=2862362 RepID=A0AAW0CHR0_9AGAR